MNVDEILDDILPEETWRIHRWGRRETELAIRKGIRKKQGEHIVEDIQENIKMQEKIHSLEERACR